MNGLIAAGKLLVVALISLFFLVLTASQEPPVATGSGDQAKVYVFVQRTDRHGKYSSSEVFMNAKNDLFSYLKEKNVTIAVDQFAGRDYAESATPMEAVYKIARDAKASSVLYVVVDRPVTKWIKVTAECFEIGGQKIWTEEASNGGGMSGDSGLKNAEKTLREKLDKHVGQRGLPATVSSAATAEKK